MKRLKVGEKLELSQLWLGMLQLGQLQIYQPVDALIDVVTCAISLGINAFDCSSEYNGHNIIATALKTLEEEYASQVAVVDKSRVRTYDEMEAMLAESLVEFEREHIDVYMLHDVRGVRDFELRKGAWEYLLEAKEMGVVHALGISTHTVEGARLAATLDGLEIVQVPFNKFGLGIYDGDIHMMAEALAKAKANNKLICAFKTIGGGAFFRSWKEALKFPLSHELVDFICVGATSVEEVKSVVAFVEGKVNVEFGEGEPNKRLLVADWCTECGDCVQACLNRAFTVDGEGIRFEDSKCTLCGACIAVCFENALFIV
jgi:diketogulonate reductase-like aldo/keto reductase/ferredoxin